MWHKGAGEQIYDIVGHTGIYPPPPSISLYLFLSQTLFFLVLFLISLFFHFCCLSPPPLPFFSVSLLAESTHMRKPLIYEPLLDNVKIVAR